MLHFLQNIVSQPWAITDAFAETLSTLLNLQYSQPGNTAKHNFGYAASGLQPKAAGQIAVYKVAGPMMKNESWWSDAKGTATMAAELTTLSMDSAISGILICVDSPGGTVDGTEQLAKVVASIKKPILVHAEMMCSAAYWAFGSANHIMAAGNTAIIGSIGTMASFVDIKPAFEKMGVKFHTIKASASTDKNIESEQALQGNYEAYIKNILDPLNAVFTGAVSKFRTGKINSEKENPLTGKIYIGKAAIKAGLADSVGSLSDAITELQSLISQKSPKMTVKSKYPNLVAAAQIADAAETLENGSLPLETAELAAIEAALSSNAEMATASSTQAKQLAALQQELTTARTAATTAQAQVAAQEATITSLQAEVTTLKAGTENPLDTRKDSDAGGKTKGKDSFDTYAEALGY